MREQTKNQGNVKAGFFHGDTLKRVAFFCGDNVEERADFTFSEHIRIVGTACAWSRGLACGVLNKLSDFFLERHFLQEFFDASFDGRIIQLGVGTSSQRRSDGLSLRKDRAREEECKRGLGEQRNQEGAKEFWGKVRTTMWMHGLDSIAMDFPTERATKQTGEWYRRERI